MSYKMKTVPKIILAFVIILTIMTVLVIFTIEDPNRMNTKTVLGLIGLVIGSVVAVNITHGI